MNLFSKLLFIFFIFLSYANAACSISDDTGKLIQLQKPAKRIISLAPDITEILFSIGAGSSVVGVMYGSDYPTEVKHIPVVGSFTGIDSEKIMSLHPDLIVTWGKTFSQQLTALHIPVYSNDPYHLTDIPKAMRNLGCLTGSIPSAEHQAENFSRHLFELEKKYSGRKRIKVFYQIGSSSLITINKNSWINQVITLCGGKNIFANATLAAPEVTWEAVVTANPQVIISDAVNTDWKSRWLKWASVDAVKNKNLYAIDPDIIERASPRLLKGTEEICKNIENSRKYT